MNEDIRRRLTESQTRIPEIHSDQIVKGGESLKYKLLSDKKVKLSHERAESYLNLSVFEGERDFYEGHVQFLLDQMNKGTFNFSVIVLASCLYKGTVYKINGQHTCWAIMFLDDNPSPEVQEKQFEVETAEQLRLLYASFDRGKVRSDPHLVRVHLAGNEALKELNARIISHLSGGFRFWLFEKKDQQRRVRSDDIADLIQNEYLSLFRAIGLYVQKMKDMNLAVLRKQAVFAALFETFYLVPTIAPSFWDAVASGEDLSRGDARLTLRNYLLTTAIDRAGSGSTKRVIDSETAYRCCIAAWNHWRKDTKIEILRTPSKRVKAI